MAQWLRIRLPMQGTQVQALVQEDPTYCGASKPVSHNYWAHVPHLLKPVCSTARAPQQEKPLQWEARALQQRVAPPLATTTESLRTATKTQHSQKLKKKKLL